MCWHIPIEELTTDDPARAVENYLGGMLGAWSADPDTDLEALARLCG